jgi:Tfp pilus assembly protein PilZ
MFIYTDFRAQFGDRVLLRLRLPSLREDSQIEAAVRWVEPDGVGVQFGSLRAMEVWGLNQLLKARPLSG